MSSYDDEDFENDIQSESDQAATPAPPVEKKKKKKKAKKEKEAELPLNGTYSDDFDEGEAMQNAHPGFDDGDESQDNEVASVMRSMSISSQPAGGRKNSKSRTSSQPKSKKEKKEKKAKKKAEMYSDDAEFDVTEGVGVIEGEEDLQNGIEMQREATHDTSDFSYPSDHPVMKGSPEKKAKKKKKKSSISDIDATSLTASGVTSSAPTVTTPKKKKKKSKTKDEIETEMGTSVRSERSDSNVSKKKKKKKKKKEEEEQEEEGDDNDALKRLIAQANAESSHSSDGERSATNAPPPQPESQPQPTTSPESTPVTTSAPNSVKAAPTSAPTPEAPATSSPTSRQSTPRLPVTPSAPTEQPSAARRISSLKQTVPQSVAPPPPPPPPPAEEEEAVEEEEVLEERHESPLSSTRSQKEVVVVSPEEGGGGSREEVLTERIRQLERELEMERNKPMRPHSAPSSRSTAQSAALLRRQNAHGAAPLQVHAFKPRHTPASHHTPLPSKRERHSSIHLGDNIYIFGGRSSAPSGRGELDPHLYAFNVATAAWKKLSTTGARPAYGRYGHTACLWHGTLPWTDPNEPQTASMIVFGGYTHSSPSVGNGVLDFQPHGVQHGGMTYCRDILCLDLETKKWSRVDGSAVVDTLLWGREMGITPEGAAAGDSLSQIQMPKRDVTAVKGHTSVVYGRRLWVFGGVRDGGHVSSHLDTLHLKKMKWVPLKNAADAKPHGVFGHTAVVWGGSMWVYGGQNSDNDRMAAVCSYNFSIGAWSKKDCIGDIPTPRSGHQAAAYKQHMVVFGGSTGHMEYSQECFILNLGTLMWEAVGLTFPPGNYTRRHFSLDAMVCSEEAEDGVSSGCSSPVAAGERVAVEEVGGGGGGVVDVQALNVRLFAFGGGGDAEHPSSYNSNQYHCTNDVLVLDLPGGWQHAARCEPVSARSMVPAGERQEALETAVCNFCGVFSLFKFDGEGKKYFHQITASRRGSSCVGAAADALFSL